MWIFCPIQQVEDDLKNKNSDLEFLLAETNEKEIQSTQSFNVLQSKLKDLEEALNQAQSESDNQSSNLSEELSQRDQVIASIKDQLKTTQADKSKMEFEIKKYVSSGMFKLILVHSLFYLFVRG